MTICRKPSRPCAPRRSICRCSSTTSATDLSGGNPVGASLLAMRAYQSTSLLNDTPQSRASSLPQGLCLFRRVFFCRSFLRAGWPEIRRM
ncbi:hypothetical protein EAH72_21005 [Pseudomonas caspiana]|uniref:Uncharacterized protein n=1 Tax=Pseudomonas mandelii TaxID=75612 RepID=A0A502IJP8_9PSED|nr:hypothetical protein EAH74_05490 [Pseudomonas mandelii]TPG93407.1 hypothetical protein EAH72_21005 [Pseudomonas caspiana]